ncbi:2-amino-3,7-dideoxy-D-threo-hept-6-ulosonate synthase [Amycolatopsis ultiminotia]|uniref:2-amino-3,7-dideoxy-D-threo-hept-6-ulosonate synthase n=2 Tax=Amycolatopsis ultiminotia TaxID=543629 RepID=A0ABP6X6W2_9PSEU
MDRLFGHGDGRLLLLALDHPVSAGPIADAAGLNRLVATGAAHRADGAILHKGRVRAIDHRLFRSMSLIVHLSASTMHAPDTDAKVLVSSVVEALRRGADAVSVHINIGSAEEAAQLGDLAAVADACDQWNMPLLAMMYPRGPRLADPQSADLIAHAAAVAVDLGADVVKTVPARTDAETADIVASCPVPIIMAGGPKTGSRDEFVARSAALLRSGVRGIAVGRNLFEDPEPAGLFRALVPVVHPVMENPGAVEREMPAPALPVSRENRFEESLKGS